MLENLVFEGGGVKGAAYAGALEALESKDLLKGVKRVAGTSAGAIVAALVATNHSAAEIKDITFKTDFNTFKDKGWFFRILRLYGIYRGDTFQKWIEKLIASKVGKPFATFTDLKNAGGKDLSVIATNLCTRGIQVFSFATTPDVIVSEAVRCSMSIPFFFCAFKLTKGFKDPHLFVDGGMVSNFPLWIYSTLPDKNTLGLVLMDHKGVNKPTIVDFGKITSYGKAILETVLSRESDTIIVDAPENAILIDDFGISATNFAITTDDKKNLHESGFKSVNDYYANPNR